MSSRSRSSLALNGCLLLAVACGGAAASRTPAGGGGGAGAAPEGTSGAPAAAGSDGGGGVIATTDPGPDGGKTGAPTRPIEASAMGPALEQLGLDPRKLPPLNKIEPDKIRKLMSTFTKALGTPCAGCHDPDDFRRATPNKKIAARMWNELVRGYTLADGGLLYCDSCHGGARQFLVRATPADKRELVRWMDQNFVAKLKRVDGHEHECATCHGDPFEGRFLAAWKK